MTHHDLKCSSRKYKPIEEGRKTAIVRFNDRNYQIDDTVTLHEGDHSIDGYQFTGNKTSARITDIDDFGCQAGYVNLSLNDIDMIPEDELPQILRKQAE